MKFHHMKIQNLVKVSQSYKYLYVFLNIKIIYKMNKLKCNYYLLFPILLIILFLLFYNFSIKESFISSIREAYRPYFRNARLFYERIYDNIKSKFLLFNRKIGLN
jgi:hypothetical protein